MDSQWCRWGYLTRDRSEANRNMNRSRRPERLGGLLLDEISRLILSQVNDPRTQGVTLTAADVSPDLRNVRVYFSVLGDEQRRQDAAQGLKSARGVIKKELGKQLNLRYVPEILFVLDDTLQNAEHIEKLLNEIKDSDQ